MANFENVIQQLVETNKKLIEGTIDLKIAQHISNSTQVLINAAKLQLDLYKATKEMYPFIEAPVTISKLKSIAKEAAELNVEDEEVISDKRPFPFD